MRVYVLYLQGLGEMERLVHPSVVIGSRKESRRLSRKGAVIAWVFFMLVAFSLAVVAMALSAMGVSFETAMTLSVATLTTTGPLTQMAGVAPIDLLALETGVKMILCAAMVLGRLETLAIIALLNPEIWTRE